jgi:hypothetical protein
VASDRELLEIVDALGPPARFSSGLNRRQEQCDQDGDDRDDDQQLDQGESAERHKVSSRLGHQKPRIKVRNKRWREC